MKQLEELVLPCSQLVQNATQESEEKEREDEFWVRNIFLFHNKKTITIGLLMSSPCHCYTLNFSGI